MTGVELWSPIAISLAGACLLGAGGVLLLGLSTRSALRPTLRTVWPEYRVLVGVFLAISALVIWADTIALSALMLIAARIGWELGQCLRPDAPWARWGGAAIGFVLPILPLPVFVVAGAWGFLLALRLTVLRGRSPMVLDMILFPILPFLILPPMREDPHLATALLAALLLSETFDSYALLSGRLFGRRPLAPALSPKKTIEGAVGGGLMLIMTAALAAIVAQDIGWGAASAGAALVGGAALTGDLAASHIKRRAGVKDFASFLPPQGGLLDVLDGWIAAAAALSLALALL